MRFSGTNTVSTTAFYQDRGHSIRSGIRVISFNEGFSIRDFNQFGYLGPGYPKSKPLHTLRIALLGDSYIEGLQVFERNHLRTHLEKLLKNSLDTHNKINRVEVLNFSRAGFNFSNMYVYYKLFVSQFSPDFVFYILDKNDIISTNKRVLWPKLKVSGDSLEIVLNYNKNILWLYKISNYFTQKSVLLNMLNKIYNLKIQVGFPHILFPDLFKMKPTHSLTNLQNDNPDLPEITQKIVDVLDSEHVILINRYEKGFPPNLLSLVKERNIPTIDLSELISRVDNKNGLSRYWKLGGRYGHWNPYSHRVIAEKISRDFLNIYFQRTNF